MKRIGVSVLSLLGVLPIAAEAVSWTPYIDGENGTVYYVDTDSLQRDDDVIRFWEIGNHARRGSNGSMSSRTFWQGDCKGQRALVMAVALFSEQMAKGKTLFSVDFPESKQEWTFAAPGTLLGRKLEILCGVTKDSGTKKPGPQTAPEKKMPPM